VKVVNTQACTSLSIGQCGNAPCMELQERRGASLTPNNSPEPLNGTSNRLSSMHIGEGNLNTRQGVAVTGNIPVIDKNGRPLMPCSPTKVRKLLKQGKARKKWDKLGIFYIQLEYAIEPDNQRMVIGTDPGSKFEANSVLGPQKTTLNIMSEATDWVSARVDTRRMIRRSRRNRNCRRRSSRFDNRHTKKVPPSTKARWQAKLNIIKRLMKIIPITDDVVEDIKATTRGQRRWDASFSPLEVGKQWFYKELHKIGLSVHLKQGMETKELRDVRGLEKSKRKNLPIFEAHCVDSWVLAATLSNIKKPVKDLYYLIPFQYHRRQLHKLEPAKGNIRRREGGTISLGIKRGTLCWYKNKLCYVGGFMKDRLSLHNYKTGKRITQTAKMDDINTIANIKYRAQFISIPEGRGFLAPGG